WRWRWCCTAWWAWRARWRRTGRGARWRWRRRCWCWPAARRGCNWCWWPAARWLCRGVAARTGGMFGLAWGRRTGAVLVALFVLGLGVAFLPGPPPLGRAAAAFYRAGALVFGGGHVVLPLLKASVVDPGWLDNNTFLAGYGAAQAVPGPMFTLASFLGARLPGGMGGAPGATVAVLAIFAPGLLLVAGALPFWRALAQRTGA